MKSILTILFLSLFTYQMSGQVSYVDINPDKTVNFEEYYTLTFGYNPPHSVYIMFSPRTSDSLPLTDQNFCINAYQTKLFFLKSSLSETPHTLNFGDPIEADSPWQYMSEWDESVITITNGEGENATGLWADVSMKFFGVKFYDGDDLYYGWIRLSTDNEGHNLTIYDYAFNTIPNEGIFAGEGINLSAQNIIIQDLADNGNEQDIYLSFNLSADSDSVDNYKAFIVPSSLYNNFDLTAAENVVDGNYMDLFALNEPYGGFIQSGINDVEGNPISNGNSYKVFIMGSYHFGELSGNSLSEASNEITLADNPVEELNYFNLEPNIILSEENGPIELDFNSDGVTDLIFGYTDPSYFDGEFSKYISIESGTCFTNYQISYATIINSNSAFQWGDKHITCLTKHLGSSQIWQCSPILTDEFYGFDIQNNDEHRYGWVRVSTGIDGQLIIKDYAFAEPERGYIMAGEGIPLTIEDLVSEDVSNNHNASDINIDITKSYHDDMISEYRIYLVPSESIEGFEISTAESLSADKYFSIPQNGQDFSGTLPTTLKDIIGNAIQELAPYYICVLSIAESPQISNALYTSSNEIVLFSRTEAVNNLTVNRTYEGMSDYIVSIDFDTPEDETGILEYRAYLVPETETNNFDTIAASTVISENYIVYNTNSPTGHISDAVNSSELHDINGNLPNQETEYKIAVMSVTNWVETNQNTLVFNDISIKFITPCLAVDSVYLTDIGSSNNSSDIEISFITPSDESQISGYRIFFVEENNLPEFNLENAQNTLDGNFLEIDPLGTAEDYYSVIIPNNMLQFNGNPIIPDEAYKVYIMSVANQIEADCNALSQASPRFIFGEPNYFFTGKLIGDNIEHYGSLSINSNESPTLLDFDINHDGVVDLQFYAYYTIHTSYEVAESKVETLNSTTIMVISDENVTVNPKHYHINKDLPFESGSFTFHEQGWSLANPGYESGLWQDNTPAYMITRTITDNDTVYAWFEIIIDTEQANIYILEYAVMGKSLNVEENIADATSVYPNPSSGIITLLFEDFYSPVEFSIFDLSGRVVVKDIAQSKYWPIDLSGFAKGVYFGKN